VDALLGIDKRSSASSDRDSTEAGVQMVLSDLKEDFFAILFAQVQSSAFGNGGFGIRTRVGV
jgi:hypothetical protein